MTTRFFRSLKLKVLAQVARKTSKRSSFALPRVLGSFWILLNDCYGWAAQHVTTHQKIAKNEIHWRPATIRRVNWKQRLIPKGMIKNRSTKRLQKNTHTLFVYMYVCNMYTHMYVCIYTYLKYGFCKTKLRTEQETRSMQQINLHSSTFSNFYHKR